MSEASTAVCSPSTWIGVPQQFVALFSKVDAVDRLVEEMFMAEFGAEMPRGG